LIHSRSFAYLGKRSAKSPTENFWSIPCLRPTERQSSCLTRKRGIWAVIRPGHSLMRPPPDLASSTQTVGLVHATFDRRHRATTDDGRVVAAKTATTFSSTSTAGLPTANAWPRCFANTSGADFRGGRTKAALRDEQEPPADPGARLASYVHHDRACQRPNGNVGDGPNGP
jgi:hypothetical protein